MQIDSHEIDVIKKYVGSSVKNQGGETMGYIAGVFSTSKKQKREEYLILGSDILFGDSTRYFAIPASYEMMRVTDESVILRIDRDDLLQTKRISLDKCPKPLFDLEPLIYEITDFDNQKLQKLKSS